MKLLTLLTLSLFITIGLRAQTIDLSKPTHNIYTDNGIVLAPDIPEPKAKVKLLYVPLDIYKATQAINDFGNRDSVSILSVDLNREPGSKFRTAIITYKKIEPFKLTK